jgi:hypothetical protein
MVKALRKVGFKIGHGSFSDICELDDFGVCCFNVGIGYHREHSTECWASLEEYRRQMRKFVVFYRENHNKVFPYSKPKVQWNSILDDIDDNYLRDMMYGKL